MCVCVQQRSWFPSVTSRLKNINGANWFDIYEMCSLYLELCCWTLLVNSKFGPEWLSWCCVGSLSCMMQRCGFEPPRSLRIFPFELTWVLTPFPQNSFGWEYKRRSSLCIPLHRLKRLGHSCPRWVNAGNKNTPSTCHPRRWNVTTSMVGLGNGYISKNLTQNGEPQIYSWERRSRRRIPYFPVILEYFQSQIIEIWFSHLDCIPFFFYSYKVNMNLFLCLPFDEAA